MNCGCKLDGTRCDFHKGRGETWHLLVAAETKAQKRVEKLESRLTQTEKALDVAVSFLSDDTLLDQFNHSMKWIDASQYEKNLVQGNLNGFYGLIKEYNQRALAEIKKLRGGE